MQSDSASTRIKSPPQEVFRFLADPANMDLWSFGTWKTVITKDGLIEGRALQDGSTIYVRIVPHADQLLIDYQVGRHANNLQTRIFIRVIEGSTVDLPNDECVLMMLAVRTTEMSDERWQHLMNGHAVEVELIRSLIETGYDHRR